MTKQGIFVVSAPDSQRKSNGIPLKTAQNLDFKRPLFKFQKACDNSMVGTKGKSTSIFSRKGNEYVR